MYSDFKSENKNGKKRERKGQKRKVKPEMRIFMGAKSVTFKLETALRDLN